MIPNRRGNAQDVEARSACGKRNPEFFKTAADSVVCDALLQLDHMAAQIVRSSGEPQRESAPRVVVMIEPTLHFEMRLRVYYGCCAGMVQSGNESRRFPGF